ncbi:basic helix-loop-helix (bHLH) DNA-binding superfamily protein [Rhynchospora pubera]|uniref:Basic helix-loop-helix (BHLH) DNA-binding superfamily protein n=1 Tax=Rhynchospora pubera TaxID=906938 RepID=A0AAV8D6N2_9POAL|nr:basic helix-loop-helix (bHLH) DNA-binding superfamily protein [Rhynchospora pubera]KAJ4816063.1 basic helix-loop-helix (bHLH) DNA-binding superfamily protein [Rhynchospora pubera]
MGEEMIQSGVCATTTTGWWNSMKAGVSFEGHAMPSPVTCSPLDNTSTTCGYTWPAVTSDLAVETKSRSSIESPGSASNSSVTYIQDCTHHTQMVSDQAFTSPVMMASTPQLMGFDLSTPVSDWNRPILNSNTGAQHDVGYPAMYQEDMSMKAYYGNPNTIGSDNNTLNQGLMLQEQANQFIPEASGSGLSLPSSLEFPSSLLRSLLAPSVRHPHPFHQNSQMGVPNNDGVGPNKWLENTINSNINAAYFDKVSSIRQPLQFSNEAQFWSPSGAISGASNIGTSIFNGNNATLKNSLLLQTAMEGVGQSSSMIKRKTENNSTLKKPRMDSPAPLPTFKVRKEKLGDRITALQQLVSPFGKTDTASVLHETIEYIKFLHDQVGVLSAPYLKNGHQMQQIKNLENPKENEGAKRDLISRGLCLVPISSTFAVASDVPVDIWAPVFGASFR